MKERGGNADEREQGGKGEESGGEGRQESEVKV